MPDMFEYALCSQSSSLNLGCSVSMHVAHALATVQLQRACLARMTSLSNIDSDGTVSLL